jgi:membrane-associated protease RseP (regulator of RpoE activity)
LNNTIFYILGALLFLAAIMVSVTLHELGHMLTAKWFKVSVTQFFVGFGKTLWSKSWRGTEYGIKMIPLGGFVRMSGMFREPGVDESEETESRWHRKIIYYARKREYDNVPEGTPQNRLFYNLPWYKKFIVLLAGPVANFAIAFVLFFVCFGVIGQTVAFIKSGQPQVSKVSNCIEDGTGVTTNHCSGIDSSPASRAGIKVGDKIVSIAGKAVNSWPQAVKAIENHANQRVTIVINRSGTNKTLSVDLTSIIRNGKSQGFLGVVNSATVKHYDRGVVYTANYMWSDTKASGTALSHLPKRMVNVIESIGGGTKRNTNDPISIVGGGELSGRVLAEPTAILSVTSKIYFMLILIASFNLFIGLFNLLPILPLDGGHIFGSLYEATRNLLRSVLKLPRLAPFDIANLLPVAYVFTIFLVVFGVVIIVADIIAPLPIPIN